MPPHQNQAALDILAFYREAGVDVAVGEEPVDRFAGLEAGMRLVSSPANVGDAKPFMRGQDVPAVPPASLQPPARVATIPVAPSASPPPPEEAVMAARTAARSAATLDELRAILETFEGCALRMTAKQLVFADGNPDARIMFVGEAPGRDEDIEGLPFVGVSGKLLDRMLAAIGLARDSVYIANIVPWRPPGNRTPTPQEAAICLPFILRQIELADPDILVCLGGPSAQALLGVKDGIRKTRGRWFNFHTGTRDIRAMATFHPAYLLRQPIEKRLVWRDFLAIKRALAENPG
jgi:uracil-DNA glycosylase family 4